MLRAALSLGLFTVVLLLAARGMGEGPFHITYTPRARETQSIMLDGRVFNDSDREVLDVWVTTEALNPAGKVLATGITFVGSSVPSRGSVAFVAKLPYVEGAQSFRLAVSSYRNASMVQSP
jgi:hypothetical protein